jgi:hypothetical protein
MKHEMKLNEMKWHEIMNEWTWMVEWLNEWMDEQMNEWMDEWIRNYLLTPDPSTFRHDFDHPTVKTCWFIWESLDFDKMPIWEWLMLTILDHWLMRKYFSPGRLLRSPRRLSPCSWEFVKKLRRAEEVESW